MDSRLPSRLRRWSDKKTGARQSPTTRGDAASAPSSKHTMSQEEKVSPPLKPEDLPPVETLTAESDFTAFLHSNVPSVLKKAALRKLWKSDPVLANVDGLNDYDENFATMGLGKAVKTAYQIGKGMIEDNQVPKTAEIKEDMENPKNEETVMGVNDEAPEIWTDEDDTPTEDTVWEDKKSTQSS